MPVSPVVVKFVAAMVANKPGDAQALIDPKIVVDAPGFACDKRRDLVDCLVPVGVWATSVHYAVGDGVILAGPDATALSATVAHGKIVRLTYVDPAAGEGPTVFRDADDLAMHFAALPGTTAGTVVVKTCFDAKGAIASTRVVRSDAALDAAAATTIATYATTPIKSACEVAALTHGASPVPPPTPSYKALVLNAWIERPKLTREVSERARRSRVEVRWNACYDARGHATSIAMELSSGDAAYDALVRTAIEHANIDLARLQRTGGACGVASWSFTP